MQKAMKLCIVVFFQFLLASHASFASDNLDGLAAMFPEGFPVRIGNRDYVKKDGKLIIAEEILPNSKEINVVLDQGKKFRCLIDENNLTLLETPKGMKVLDDCKPNFVMKDQAKIKGVKTSSFCLHSESGEHLFFLWSRTK